MAFNELLIREESYSDQAQCESLAHPLRGKFCILPKVDNLWRKIFMAFAHMHGQMLTERGVLPA